MRRLSLALTLLFPIAASAQSPTFAWKSVNIQGMGYVTGMVISPLPPNSIYIRTDVGGAYRYDRAAERWLPLLDRFGTANSAYGVESIAADPNDPNTVYAAVANNQVFTATGGGYYSETTWGDVLVSHSRGVWWTDTQMPWASIWDRTMTIAGPPESDWQWTRFVREWSTSGRNRTGSGG